MNPHSALVKNGWIASATWLAIYWILGVIHELVHLLAAITCSSSRTVSFSWSEILFHRTANLQFRSDTGPFDEDDVLVLSATDDAFIRHAGWLFSLSLALALLLARGRRRRPSRIGTALYDDVTILACLTAVESIATDLLQLVPTPTQLPSSYVYYCGNFGILLIGDAWFQDKKNRSKALDILEHMCQVTMVRGAQSGGVVSYHPASQQATRVRVVNRKRTDLSQTLRYQIQRRITYSPRAYIGHTRFATSSKATLGGTHPHQWSPPQDWRCLNEAGTQFVSRRVENYITHNGDFDFLSGAEPGATSSSLSTIREWLECTTGTPTPDAVDSCAVAGVVDIFRTAGSFSLSARYALAAPKITKLKIFPKKKEWEALGEVFEREFLSFCKTNSLEKLTTLAVVRKTLADHFVGCLRGRDASHLPPAVTNVTQFVSDTIDAFFRNDLMWATRTFMDRAKGSFGISVSSSLDANSQLCLAARGQTVSVAFYPGFVLYGSEQAAVKAGLEMISAADLKEPVQRLDLDDLGGEVLLLDWSGKESSVSTPTDNVRQFRLLQGKLRVDLYQQTRSPQTNLHRRLTKLTGNPMIKKLPPKSVNDPILVDIRAIPRILKGIQAEWAPETPTVSSNRLAAFTLGRALRTRLKAQDGNRRNENRVDILITGCEVSLWLGEQFAADLQKALPRLRIVAMSSNKLLGLYGQSISVPTIGFPYAPTTYDLNDSIVIIISQSGGTFAPLLCSNLLQSTTSNLFVVTSESDTQIGRQLRALDASMKCGSVLDSISTRIFSTTVGLRPAEPASVTVAATQQLLTNLFMHICVIMIEDPLYRRATGATITEEDLRILEKCNNENIEALSEIVGRDAYGYPRRKDGKPTRTESELRGIGNLWAEHVLENAKAYIMTIIYVLATVVSGWPVASALARAGGLPSDHELKYLVSFIDAVIYIALPQINIMILRIIQRRNLLHRMVGRTVVVADIPWVSQSVDTFVSKLFACSYSIAGLNVLSSNPSDHLVHRVTHRVVRGTLLIAGRPDGRLSALTTKESAVCLSVTQASSIQSWGGTCESITVGHNPSELPLTKKGIFLGRKRPLFLCERMLIEADNRDDEGSDDERPSLGQRLFGTGPSKSIRDLDQSFTLNCSVRGRSQQRNRYAASILGHYTNFSERASEESTKQSSESDDHTTASVLQSIVSMRQVSESARQLFLASDTVCSKSPHISAEGTQLTSFPPFCHTGQRWVLERGRIYLELPK